MELSAVNQHTLVHNVLETHKRVKLNELVSSDALDGWTRGVMPRADRVKEHATGQSERPEGLSQVQRVFTKDLTMLTRPGHAK